MDSLLVAGWKGFKIFLGRLQSGFFKSLAVGLIGIFPTGVMAEDILEIYELAQQNDRTLSAAKNQFEATKQAQKQVKGLYYPTLELSYESLDTDQTINRSDNEVFGTGESNYPTDVFNLSLTQPLFRWDYRSERKKAKAEVRQGEFELIAAEQELMQRSAENYLLALAAQDTRVMAQAELDAVGEQLKLSEKRFDIGLANTGEVNESRARHQLNQAELIQTENAVSDRMQALAVIVGSVPTSLKPLKDEFMMVPPEPANIESWVARAEQDNYSLQSSVAAVEVADAEYARHKADRLPDIDLFANLNNRDAQGSLFGGGSDVDTTDIGVRAQWTLFQGGRLRAKIREAMYNKQQAEDELEVARSNVKRETRSAYLGVVSSIARVAALKSSLDAQDMSVQAKQKGFDTGTNSNLEVLDAKRDFFFVKRDYLKARYDYLLNMLNLKRLVGSLAPADLAQINNVLVGGSGLASAMAPAEPALIQDIGTAADFADSPAIEIESLAAVSNEEIVASVDDDTGAPAVASETTEVIAEAAETAVDDMQAPSDLDVIEDSAEEVLQEAEAVELPEPQATIEVEDLEVEELNTSEINEEPVVDADAQAADIEVATNSIEIAEEAEAIDMQGDTGVELATEIEIAGEVAAADDLDEFEVVADAPVVDGTAEGAELTDVAEASDLELPADAFMADKQQANTTLVEPVISDAGSVIGDRGAAASDWLNSLPANSYTLQLATLGTLERCRSLETDLNIGTIHCLESSPASGRWIALTGSFESRPSSNLAKVEMGVADAWTRYVPRILATRCGMAGLDSRYQAACNDADVLKSIQQVQASEIINVEVTARE